MQDVAGKAAFITGGASGIGYGIAQALIAARMKVVIADVDADAGSWAETALRAVGDEALFVEFDVTQSAQ